jgi:hypothetical protein
MVAQLVGEIIIVRVQPDSTHAVRAKIQRTRDAGNAEAVLDFKARPVVAAKIPSVHVRIFLA